MLRISETLMRLVLLVLLVELFASFLVERESPSRGGASYDVSYNLSEVPSFLKEQEEESVSFASPPPNFFNHDLSLLRNPSSGNQKGFFINRPPRFALFCSLLI
jgi:hypothetical protein